MACKFFVPSISFETCQKELTNPKKEKGLKLTGLEKNKARPMAKKLSKEEGLKKEPSSRFKKTVANDYLTVFFKKTEKDEKKIVCVVSKKISKKAVERNRIRRLLLESLRPFTFEQKLIIKVKKNISKFKKSDVETIILPLIHKLR